MKSQLILAVVALALGCNEPALPPADAERQELQERLDEALAYSRHTQQLELENEELEGRVAQLEAKLRESSELLKKTKRLIEQAALNRNNPEFPITISGSLFGSELDTRLFRACAALQSDADARNLYLWGQNTLYKMRDEMRPMDSGIKLVNTAAGRIATDGESARIYIEKNSR